MISLQSEFRDLLNLKFSEIRERNSKVSLRGFAKIIGLAPSEVSLFLNNKREFGTEKIKSVLENLKLSEIEEKRFNLLLEAAPSHQIYDLGSKFQKVESDQFSVISEWYYFAIMSLLDLPNAPQTSEDIGLRLNIPSDVAHNAIEVLYREGFISRVEGKLVANHSHMATLSEIPNEHIRHNHKQHLELAARALDEVAVEDRDITGITFNIDKNKMDDVKSMIKDFRRSLTMVASSSEESETYRLAIQFFPLTNQKNIQ